MEDKSIEVWKYTYLTDNYEVSNFGNIRKSSSKKLLKPYLKPNGFLGVTLSIDNVKYYKIVHRIVCKTFIKDFDNSYVYHKDNNKLNNNLNNLNYNTYKNENEIWLKCNITNDYIISNLGNIKSLKSNKIMKKFIDKNGYCKVSLKINNKYKTFSIHRLVMMAFKYNEYFKDAHVNHINFNKSDNRPENLEWCTPLENKIHAKNNDIISRGESHGMSKLNNEKVKEIRKLYEQGFKKTEISRKHNVSYNAIHNIINKKYWSFVE